MNKLSITVNGKSISVKESENLQNTYYCIDLEQNINFDVDKITPCCPPPQYITPHISYDGNQFPLNEFLNMRETTKNNIINNKSQCFQCPNLKIGKPNKSKYLLHSITINHFKNCNLRCSYCKIWYPENQNGYKTGYTIYNILQWIFDNNLIDPQGIIIWGGGEPTIYNEFPKIIDLISSKKIQTMINTNCIIFSKPLYNAIQKNYATMQVSLDCGDKETYIKMKGKDEFINVISTLQMYNTPYNKNITLKYIINDKNNSKEEIIKFLDIAKNLRISHVNLSAEAYEASENNISCKTFDGIKIFLLESKKRHIKVTIFREIFGKNYYNILDKIYLSVCLENRIIKKTSDYINRISPTAHNSLKKLYNNYNKPL